MLVRLREWRERRGYSIRELANRANVSRMTVFRIESRRVSPTVAVLEKLARALRIRVGDLFPRPRAAHRPRKSRR
jgi:transcriptional regulator with XRE-family HTH domain